MRVIFIPWSAAESDEFVVASQQWNDALRTDNRASKAFTIVTWEGGRNDVIANADNGVIYMRGHGTPGSPNVTSKGKVLHITDSIDRLIRSGLKPGFSGKIKFYSCYSGLDAVAKMRREMVQVPKTTIGPLKFGTKTVERMVDKALAVGEGSYDALAKRGAAEFRRRGYNNCTFFGYSGPLSRHMEARAEEELADGHVHKHCLMVTFNEGTAISELGGRSTGRLASQARAQF